VKIIMAEKISSKNEDSVQERYNYKKKVKVKRLKIGMILVLVAGALFIICESFFVINQNWYNFQKQLVGDDYTRGLINFDHYSEILGQLDHNLYLNIFVISIFSTITKLSVYCASIFLIISLLSIVLDESFHRKMRRISLGLAVLIVLFLLYPIIAGANTINNYYYGYWI
jgi:hypothetical protein